MLNNKLKALLFVSMLSISSIVLSAPQTPKHSKMLYIKQTSFASGVVCTVATISMPATVGNKDVNSGVEYMRQSIAAQPIKTGQPCPNPVPGTSNYLHTASEFPPIGIVDFADLKAKLEFLYSQEATASANYYANLAASYPGWSQDDLCYQLGECGINAKSYVDSYYSAYPEYALAIYIRQTSSDYSSLTDETVKKVTNFHMNNSGQAKAFKQAVIDYLKKHNIMYAFVDIETEVSIQDPSNPALTIPKRSAATMMLANRETTSSKGQYTGAVVIPPPNSTNSPSYKNRIDISYTTKLQYPDFYNSNAALLGDRAADFGMFRWTTPSAVDPVMSSTSLDTNGVYDSPFPGQDPAHPDPDNRSIFNMSADEEPRGAKCALEPTPDCFVGAETILSLMRKNNASMGTFTYYGRWELKPLVDASGNELMSPTSATVQENSSSIEYDLCNDIRFFNDISVNYDLVRYVWKYDISYDPSSGTFFYAIKDGYPQIDKTATTTTATRYISSSTIMDPTSKLVKFIQVPRDINTTDFIERSLILPTAGSYSNAMVDPLTWSLATDLALETSAPATYSTSNHIAAKGFVVTTDGDQLPDWSSRMINRTTPVFTRSSSLPVAFTPVLAQGRSYHFNCRDINEDQINKLDLNIAYVPGGHVAAAVISAGAADGDLCTAEYKKWESQTPKAYTTCPVGSPPSCVPTEILVAGAPTIINLNNNACTESCAIGSPSKTCARPYPRQ